MKSKNKEVYFVFAFLIILIMSFFLGRYYTLAQCYEQKEFNSDQLEKCYYDLDSYEDFCGPLKPLESDNIKQECINECFS